MELIFETPPDAAILRSRPGKYVEFAVALREHQDKWALLPEDVEPRTDKGAQSLAQNIRRGVTSGFTRGEYESVSDGPKVYVRWIGKKVEPAQSDDVEIDLDDDEGPTPRDASLAPQVRAWARNNGLTVPNHGRISDEIWAAYYTDTTHKGSHVQAVR